MVSIADSRLLANLEGLPYEVQLKIVRCLLRDEQPFLIVRGVNVTTPPSEDFGIAAVSKYFDKLAMQVFYGEDRFQYYDAYSLTFPSAVSMLLWPLGALLTANQALMRQEAGAEPHGPIHLALTP